MNLLDQDGKRKIEHLYQMIEDNGHVLADSITFDNDQRTIIQVIDIDAEYSDEVLLFENYSPHEVLRFLKDNRLVK